MVAPFTDLRDRDAENFIYLVLSGLTTRPTLPASLVNSMHSASRAGKLVTITRTSSAYPQIYVNLSYGLIHSLNYLLHRTYLTQRGKCRGAITPRRPILAHAVRYCLYSSACSMRQPVAGSNVARSHARANCSFSCAACWCACCCC